MRHSLRKNTAPRYRTCVIESAHMSKVIVSGSIGEESAIDAMHQGASDYVFKDRLIRLPQ